MKKFFNKCLDVLRLVFGYGIMLTLFAGGLTFIGYIVALIIGGNTAELICHFIYKQFLPVIVNVASVMILLGIVIMYLSGETALTATKKRKKKNNAE